MATGERVLESRDTVPEDGKLATTAAQASEEASEDLSGETPAAREDPNAIETCQTVKPDVYTSLVEIFRNRYGELGRLALMITHDRANAEDIVTEAFAGALRNQAYRLDSIQILAYLRQSVVNGAISALRRKSIAEKYAARFVPVSTGDTTADDALQGFEGELVRTALRRLPPRQRQALFLRYYCDMSEAQAATTMGISLGAIKSHTSRGLTNLKRLLQP